MQTGILIHFILFWCGINNSVLTKYHRTKWKTEKVKLEIWKNYQGIWSTNYRDWQDTKEQIWLSSARLCSLCSRCNRKSVVAWHGHNSYNWSFVRISIVFNIIYITIRKMTLYVYFEASKFKWKCLIYSFNWE